MKAVMLDKVSACPEWELEGRYIVHEWLTENGVDYFCAHCNLKHKAQSGAINKRGKTMKLEIAMLVGPESKQFLVDLTKVVERMEAAQGIGSKTKSTAPAKKTAPIDDEDEDATDSTDDDEDFAPAKKKAAGKKAASSFDDEDEDATDSTDDDEDFEAPAKKKSAAPAKKKALTVKDVTAACKARAEETSVKETRELLKKKFKVDSVQDLKPEQFEKAIALLEDLG